jgi:hypothetical protein
VLYLYCTAYLNLILQIIQKIIIIAMPEETENSDDIVAPKHGGGTTVPPCEHQSNDDFIQGLGTRLRYSGLFFVDTTDYIRLNEDIQEVCNSGEFNLVHWDSHTGFRLYNEDGSYKVIADTAHPVKAFDCMVSVSKGENAALEHISGKTLFCFRFIDANFKQSPQNLLFIDRIINILPYMRFNNISILFYGPDVCVPPHLQDDSTQLEYVMPGEDVIGSKFDFIYRSVRKAYPDTPECTEEFRRLAVKSALGQSAPMAEATFAHALATTGRSFDQDFLDIVKKQTISRVREIGLVTPVEPTEADSFENALGGYDYLEEMVDDDIAALMDPNLSERTKKVPKPSGVLLGGNAGRGKSVCVKAIARKFNLPLLRVDASSIKSKYYGGSEERLRKILNIPRSVFGRGGCIIWFDEADKLIGGFGKGDDSTSGTGKNVLGDILVWMQERKKDDRDWSYVIATFNDGSVFPDAFLRRFSAKAWLHLPTADDRHKIFELHLRNLGRDLEDFDVSKLVRKANKFSGAEIEMACETMAKRAYNRGIEDEQDLLLACIDMVHPDAATPTEEYMAQEKWAQDRKFGNVGFYDNSDEAAPLGRQIVLDKKNAIENQEEPKTNG